ncbi:MBL fold metallo-hydrolase [Halobacillus sp. A1]|uniref:MBL fold metallo-hydrolase n=1 Tax=Halobacillus sp. A1 TaxID=2880262 RepID=UPI0020A6993E|nr:MBL fold metallo-hydrolase [Halobacillus sp. A1]MCP3032639.1 MBL fold metallo-hydrolase [Halobacillus sp. A1]
MKTLKDTIHKLTIPTPYAVGDVHVYILEGEAVTLIDAGVKTEEAWESMKKQLLELNITPEDVEQVVLTHHHPDHMGLVENFPNVRRIAGHPKLKPWLERDSEFFDRYEQFFHDMYSEAGVPNEYFHLLKGLRKPLKWTAEGKLNLELLEGDSIPNHEEWRVIETPGHAQSHLSFFRHEDGALLGGDHLLFHISSNPLLEPPFQPNEPRPKPLIQYRQSMKKLLEYPITTVYPGHGKTFNGVEELIEKRILKQEERALKVKEMFVNGPLTAFQVCEQLFPKHITTQFGLTMSETIGQLDYLEETNQIEVNHQGRLKKYYVNR